MLAYNIELMEVPQGQAETMVAALMEMLVAACDAAIPRNWWNGSLNQLRSECFRARRQAQRTRGSPQHAQLHEAYRAKRAELRNGIAAAKANAFKELLASVDEDPWGIASTKWSLKN